MKDLFLGIKCEVRLLIGDFQTLLNKIAWASKKSFAWLTVLGVAYILVKLIFDLTT